MKTWVEAGSSEELREAARDPVYRLWEHTDGTLWLIGLEFASLQRDSQLRITFRNAGRELATSMPPDKWLGELTTQELSWLLREAS